VETVTAKETALEKQIKSGDHILIVEIAPPQSGDPAPVQAAARRFAGRVHALGFSANRDGVRMSALAAAALAAREGVEPILHVVTRDQNRVALVSECLGAQALGIRNIFCTSGEHQTLGAFHAARNVFDIDSVQLLKTLSELGENATIVGAPAFDGAGPFCLGGVASAYGDPIAMHVARLGKKICAGAQFLVTEPVFDLERFCAWWEEVSRTGLQERVAILAGIEPLTDLEGAQKRAGRRPDPLIPGPTLERLAGKLDRAAQRAEGIAMACETMGRLEATVPGLRGFAVSGVTDAVLELLDASGKEIT